MSETVIENVVQTPVKKKWNIKIVLFPLMFFAFAIWTDSSFTDAIIFSFFGFPFYWFWKKAHNSDSVPVNHSMESRSSSMLNENSFQDSSNYTPSYFGVPGYDASGTYTGSDTSIGGISN